MRHGSAGRLARSAVVSSIVIILLTVAGAVTVAAQHRQRARPPAHRATIEATAFAPSILHVKAGDRIVWTNRDPFPHTVTSHDGAFDSKTISPDGSWTYRANRKGTFGYICTLHPTMKGTLVVE